METISGKKFGLFRQNQFTMNKVFKYLIVILGITTWVLYERGQRLLEERDTYISNTNALLSDIQRMKIDSSKSAVDVKTLKLTLDEYKSYRVEDLAMIKQMGVEIKTLKSVARHDLVIDAPFQTEVRDTIYFKDTTRVMFQVINMETPYLKITGCIMDKQLKGNIILPVTLNQAIWIEYKHHFLWWRWKVKAIHQTIMTDNPHVKIKYSEFINIDN